eukprot:9383367-Pyramimonas_sp.AAC.1
MRARNLAGYPTAHTVETRMTSVRSCASTLMYLAGLFSYTVLTSVRVMGAAEQYYITVVRIREQ